VTSSTSILLLSFITVGQTAPASPEVDALLAKGVELREQQRDADALALFEKAYQLSKSGRALAQVAFAEQALGRWVAAEKHLSDALAGAPDAWITSRRDVLTTALASIRTHVGDLEISCELPGAQVKIDGQFVAQTPLAHPLRVQAGTSVVLEVSAPGYWPSTRVVVVSPSAPTRELLTLARRDVAAAPPEPARPGTVVAAASPAGSSGLSPPFWVGSGLAVVGVAGLIAGVVANSKAVDQADQTPNCHGILQSQYPAGCPDYQTPRTIAWVSAGAGAAGAALAIVSLVLASNSERHDEASVVWSAGPTPSGIQVSAEF